MELHGTDTSSYMEFHEITWNFKCANFDDTSSSMEFHGTSSAPISRTPAVPWNSTEFWSAPISRTRAVPWNSMELGGRQFRWHEQFHGIPWNLGCANFADTSSSLEFHGTWSAPITMTRAVPWNYMEFQGTRGAPISQTPAVPWNSMGFHGTWSAPISLTRAVPWNAMGLGVGQFRWHEQFHGIPWKLECANFDDTSSSFHGTSSAPISLIRAVPWNSMEPGVRQFRWHEQFHGIQWNLGCANFADTSSSMGFHGTWSAPISMTRAVPMEFNGTWDAPISLTPAVPWNSMELGVGRFHWHEQFHGMPWN